MTCEEKLKRALAEPWEFVGEPLALCQLLRAECLRIKAENDEFWALHDAMKEGFAERLADVERERDFLKAENEFLKRRDVVL